MLAFKQNAAVIAQAPWAFFEMAVVIAGLTWAFSKWAYSKRITDIKDRLKLRDDQIAEFKKRLDDDSPEYANESIEALKAQVDDLQPRSLTADVLDDVRQAASSHAAELRIAEDGDGTHVLARDLRLAFEAAGWTVSAFNSDGEWGVADAVSGMRLLVPDHLSGCPATKACVAALNASSHAYEIVRRQRPEADTLEIRITQPV